MRKFLIKNYNRQYYIILRLLSFVIDKNVYNRLYNLRKETTHQIFLR